MKRVVVYIDGFNVYFGLKDNNWACYYWLDYAKLAQRLANDLREDEGVKLTATKYFTSRISSPEDKRKRQLVYLEALECSGNLEIFYGNYRDGEYLCTGCGRRNYVPHEKQTDVNIAVQMLSDAFQDNFDTAILVGGDSDLVPPIVEVRKLFKNKKVICVFPPKRASKEIQKACNGVMHLGEVDLKNNQLPDSVTKGDGYVLERPKSWR